MNDEQSILSGSGDADSRIFGREDGNQILQPDNLKSFKRERNWIHLLVRPSILPNLCQLSMERCENILSLSGSIHHLPPSSVAHDGNCTCHLKALSGAVNCGCEQKSKRPLSAISLMSTHSITTRSITGHNMAIIWAIIRTLRGVWDGQTDPPLEMNSAS